MIHEMVMPSVGHYSEGAVKILTWQVREGDRVDRGQEILEVETEKSVVVIEAFRTGYLRKILAIEGDEVPIGGVLALISDAPTEPIPVRYLTGKEKAAPPTGLPAVEATPAAKPVRPYSSGSIPEAIRAMPAARLLADKLDVDITRVQGSGPNGIITEADVRTAAGSIRSEAEGPG